MPAKASAALRVPCRGGRPQCNLAPSLIRSYWSAVFSTFRGQHVADTQQPKRGERAVSNHLSTAQSLSFCLFWHRYYCAWYWEPTCIDCGGSLRPLSCKHLGWSWAGCRRRRPAQAAHVRVMCGSASRRFWAAFAFNWHTGPSSQPACRDAG